MIETRGAAASVRTARPLREGRAILKNAGVAWALLGRPTLPRSVAGQWQGLEPESVKVLPASGMKRQL
jgi:hypothetical protein